MTDYNRCEQYALVVKIGDHSSDSIVSALEMLENLANIINSQTFHEAFIDDRYADPVEGAFGSTINTSGDG